MLNSQTKTPLDQYVRTEFELVMAMNAKAIFRFKRKRKNNKKKKIRIIIAHCCLAEKWKECRQCTLYTCQKVVFVSNKVPFNSSSWYLIIFEIFQHMFHYFGSKHSFDLHFSLNSCKILYIYTIALELSKYWFIL